MLRSLLLAPISFLMILATFASAQTLPAANDCFCTQAGPDAKFMLPISLPQGFFGQIGGMPSDSVPAGTVIFVKGEALPIAVVNALCPVPFATQIIWIDPHGEQQNPATHFHLIQQTIPGQPVDTIVRRPTATSFPGGAAGPVDIELVELSLKSVSPLQVNFPGHGMEPFDVFVTEDGVQNLGSMQVSPTQLNPLAGSTEINGLPLQYLLNFVHVPGTLPSQQMGGHVITLKETRGSLSVGTSGIPDMSTWALILLAGALMVVGAMAHNRRSHVVG